MINANNITATQNNQTMSSIELLKVINKARKDFGEKPVRLNDFNNRIALSALTDQLMSNACFFHNVA